MGGFPLVMVTIGMMTVVFLVALDHYILAQAVPRITTDFNSLEDAAWYSSGYFLTSMAMQPAFGQIYTYFSVKYIYMLSVLFFEAGSIVCALAPSSTALILGRLITGVGGGGLYIGTVVLVGYVVPVNKRPIYISIVSSLDGAASVAGPLLGGVFTNSYLTWRFCFWVNLPIGFIAIMLMTIFFRDLPKRSETTLPLKAKLAKINYLSIVLLLGSFTMLLLALQWAGPVYVWTDPHVLGCLVGAGVVLAGYLYYQYYLGDKAAIPYRILAQRTVFSSAAFMLLIAMVIGVGIYYLPFYFQAVLGTSAQTSGIENLPFLVSLMFSPLISGFLISWLGHYVPFMYFGAILSAVGSGLLATFSVSTPKANIIAFQFIAGLGAGISHQIPYTSVQFSLPSSEMVLGSALVSFLNCLGTILGIVAAQAVFGGVLIGKLDGIPNVDAGVVFRAGPTNVANAVPEPLVSIVRSAYGVALQKTFILPTVLSCLCCICCLKMEWKRLKASK
ncbi:MFS general substrate transporter [Cenococcum geophilum 1.58]|uniref:MFS general substrate transporter n=1 Tax=Cenococcum geophilum 1.58 TaxID=794803 RepID=UPI00358F08B0|nr:MFS general substrate transporter [Cenococcum geophilum 1.58]